MKPAILVVAAALLLTPGCAARMAVGAAGTAVGAAAGAATTVVGTTAQAGAAVARGVSGARCTDGDTRARCR